jgi:hypothetical protein
VKVLSASKVSSQRLQERDERPLIFRGELWPKFVALHRTSLDSVALESRGNIIIP